MAADVVISVEHLAKRYALGRAAQRHGSLREALHDRVQKAVGAAASLFSGPRASARAADEEFWALKDVSFEVGRGEVVGVIGHNGAGKSTLLKLLSRITEPTEGRIRIAGRVASLLEVGTGFHPELTGRENVFLNGAILGMSQAEIRRKFDEIVAFAEVERFIDTPVKRYSSGMYVRLAFAVAAHLEPEILIVDEVLAVGDLAFQKKCLGKMQDTASSGHTVLVVSHNMQVVQNLCPRSLLLSQGRLVCMGETQDTIERYHSLLGKQKVDQHSAIDNERHRRGSGSVRFSEIALLDADGAETFQFRAGERMRFAFSYVVTANVPELWVAFALRGGSNGEILTGVRHRVSDLPCRAGETGSFEIEFPGLPLQPGQYPIYCWLGNALGQPFDVVDDMTLPLTIAAGRKEHAVSMGMGFFQLESRLTARTPLPRQDSAPAPLTIDS